MSEIATADPVAVTKPSTSKILATIGRVVLLFCPALWDGPQPALVTGAFSTQDGLDAGSPQLINCNVYVDGANHPKALAEFRNRASGNTFTSVELYNALTPAYRDLFDAGHCWAEWMPYQVGQATKAHDLSTNVAAEVTQLRADLAKAEARIPPSGALDTVHARIDAILSKPPAGTLDVQPMQIHPDGVVNAIRHLASASPDTLAEIDQLLQVPS